MSCTSTTKYTAQVLDRNPPERCSELIHSLCPTSMLWYQSQSDSPCPATEGTWQWGSCMQVWCTGSFSLFTTWMLAFMLILYTQYTSRHHRAPWWHCVPLMQLSEQRTKLQCVPLMSSRGRYSGFLQEFLHPSCDWIQGLKALIYSCFSWSLLSEAVTTVYTLIF